MDHSRIPLLALAFAILFCFPFYMSCEPTPERSLKPFDGWQVLDKGYHSWGFDHSWDAATLRNPKNDSVVYVLLNTADYDTIKVGQLVKSW
jgi:hypothetical protein